MGFHELATNAAKYGALSTPTGRVSVEWALDPAQGGVVIDWRESGGPPVIRPARVGFGLRLVERALPRELGGQTQIFFRPGGLHCRISLPFSAKLDLAA